MALPRSMRREEPGTRARTASTTGNQWRGDLVGRPSSLAHTFPVPPGSTPKATGLSAIPLTTSLIVPSPPTMKTASSPSSRACLASWVASPARSVWCRVVCQPCPSRWFRTTGNSRRTSHGPDLGLTISLDRIALYIQLTQSFAARSIQPCGAHGNPARPEARNSATEQHGATGSTGALHLRAIIPNLAALHQSRLSPVET